MSAEKTEKERTLEEYFHESEQFIEEHVKYEDDHGYGHFGSGVLKSMLSAQKKAAGIE